MKMSSIQEYVEVALLKYPQTRGDDDILYIEVCKMINPLVCGHSFENVLINRAQFGVPNYKYVSRARRKIQEGRPDLKPTEKKIDARFKKWKEMRNYALEEQIQQ